MGKLGIGAQVHLPVHTAVSCDSLIREHPSFNLKGSRREEAPRSDRNEIKTEKKKKKKKKKMKKKKTTKETQ